MEPILSHLSALVGGGGLVGITWAFVAWYKRKRDADLADKRQELEAQSVVVAQLRESLEYQRKLTISAEERRIAVDDHLSEVRDEVFALKTKLIEATADNIRLKGELLQWQQKKGN